MASHLISTFLFFKLFFVFPAPRAHTNFSNSRFSYPYRDAASAALTSSVSLSTSNHSSRSAPPAKSSVNTPSFHVQVALARCAAEWRTEVPDGTMSIDRLFDYTVQYSTPPLISYYVRVREREGPYKLNELFFSTR